MYHEERLRILFRIAYQQGDQAFTHWQTHCEKRGFASVYETLKTDPFALGKLKGRLILGFKKNQQRQDAEMALSELQHLSKKHYVTKLQLDEARQLLNTEQVRQVQHQRQRESKTRVAEYAESSASAQVNRSCSM